MSVPLVLAIVFIVMLVMGIDLHRISLGALIIALGLLVDDAIIALEMMVVRMEQGWERAKAAAAAWDSTAFPMLTGTLITAAGFVPIASPLRRGRVHGLHLLGRGHRAGGLVDRGGDLHPLSRREAPADFAAKMRAKGIVHTHEHAIYETRGYNLLRAVIRWCVTHRIKVVVATLGVFGLAVFGFTKVQQQFFPLSERPELFFQMRLPEGSSITASTAVARKAEEMLKDDKGIESFSTYVGQGSPRFWLGLNPQLPNEAFAEIVIVAKDLKAREATKARIEQAVAEGALAEARVRVDRFNFGPPVGFPVQFRVVGPDPQKVREYAARSATSRAAIRISSTRISTGTR